MSESVAPADPGLAVIERLCWHLSGWQVEQRAVDELLAEVRAYAHGVESSGAGAPLAYGGAGAQEAAVRPVESLTAPDGPVETSKATSGPHMPVQRIHITGTITLAGPRKRAQSKTARAKPRKRQWAVPDPRDLVPEDTRTCRLCGTTHAITDYARDTHGTRGRKSVCRTCENLRKRDARRAKRAAAP